MILPGEHISVFGISGCGKSTLTRKLASVFPRRVIFDRLMEWEDGGEVVSSFEEFAALYKERYEAPRFSIIVRTHPGLDTNDLLDLVDSILALVYQVESHASQGIALVFEEVWLYAPIFNTPPWFNETLLTGRHHKISILGNSQRPASVSKTLISQSRHVFIGQYFESNDRKYFREALGLPLDHAPPAKYAFLWYRHDRPLQTVTVSP